jgi:hypothetical protein
MFSDPLPNNEWIRTIDEQGLLIDHLSGLLQATYEALEKQAKDGPGLIPDLTQLQAEIKSAVIDGDPRDTE